MKKENKKTLVILEKAAQFCAYFGTIRTTDEKLKKNLLTTTKGLGQAIELLKALDDAGVVIQ